MALTLLSIQIIFFALGKIPYFTVRNDFARISQNQDKLPAQELITDTDYKRKSSMSNLKHQMSLNYLDRKPIEKTLKIPLCDLSEL